jgi:hypothetical protein
MHRLLVVDNNDEDYRKIHELLSSNFNLLSEINRVEGIETATDRFMLDPHDVYLIDLTPDNEDAITLIQEGVESAQQMTLLEEYGCDEIQGYLFSKPLSQEDFTDYLEKYWRPGSLASSSSSAKNRSITTLPVESRRSQQR